MASLVERVPVGTETRWSDGRTNAYVVGRAGGLLVDPGAVDSQLTAAVEARDVAHVAVTHTHRDHVGAVGRYGRSTGVTVWAHERAVDAFEAATGVEADRTFRPGEAVGPATVVGTPGHAIDHVAFRVDDEALVGDLAVAEGSVVVGGADADLRSYLVSLRRLRHAGLRRLHPGHGPPIDEPATTLERLLVHRLRRERAILEAVEAGAATLEAITEAAYRKDLTGVEDLARRTVEAHLEKLAQAGRIRWDGERAVPG